MQAVLLNLPTSTPSLRLRHFVLEDAPKIMALNAEPSTRRWLPSHVYANADKATDAVRFLVSSYASPGDPRLGAYVLAVDHSRTGELVGHVGFSPLANQVEVSFAVAESARGHGYGAEALRDACSLIANAFGLSGILAITAAANACARKTLARARFAYERDEVMQFQGSKELVSRYHWPRQSVGRCGG